MKLPRTSIVSLMLVVGIVALNLAFGRAIFLGEPWRLAGIGRIGVIIHVLAQRPLVRQADPQGSVVDPLDRLHGSCQLFTRTTALWHLHCRVDTQRDR